MADFQEYVVGFAFAKSSPHVLLIQKNRPHWQAGLLNGVGGKVEPHEGVAAAAMAREFQEEAGIYTHPLDWKKVAVGENRHYRVTFYSSFDCDIFAAKTMTDERLHLINLGNLSRMPLIASLHWLVPMAYQAEATGLATPVQFRWLDTDGNPSEGE